MPQSTSSAILLVDDESHILKATKLMLNSKGFTDVLTAQDSRQVMEMLGDNQVAVVVLDLFMPMLSGQELLRLIVERYPQIAVIVMTALDETQSAVDCMRNGAFDYLVKPVETARLVSSVTKALEVHNLTGEVSRLKEYLLTDRLNSPAAFESIITCDKHMRSIFQYVEVIAQSRQPVLITGETGVGKDLLAKAIHNICRCKGDFVAVNVAGLDDAMFSDTLFGHKKGAYTGADQAREGLIARASGGTIFLDEIGDLSDSSQIKLLRLLQENDYYPVGSDIPRKSDARVIVATNKPFKELIAAGKFRNDLYYRLCTHQIEIPALRARPDDIPLLAEHFTAKASRSLNCPQPPISRELLQRLKTYDFPGNIRELEAMIYDAVARQTNGPLTADTIRQPLAANGARRGQTRDYSCAPDDLCGLFKSHFGSFPTLRQMEDYLILEAMREGEGNQGAAATLLGITRQTLNKRLGEIRKEAE